MAETVAMAEADLQAAVQDLAVWRGWRSYHTFDSRRSNAGFPDLVLWRDHRLIFAELKGTKGKLRPEQAAVLEALEQTAAEVFVWGPPEWLDGSIDAALA